MISQEAYNAMLGALVSRGARKGKLKANCPPMGTPEAAAWQAMMMTVNPYKVGIGHMIFMGDAERAIYDEVLALGGAIPSALAITLDKDREALESMGAW